ncbi:hypothetical protein KF728_12820 [Candidatus Obscuribacterales bacterium]|nr:hypothetical protein [Candidatus Obscuribacterales bacterium]MBX3151026.1 hypothetical protein [Candidatus Obscuribacterales bacterium]
MFGEEPKIAKRTHPYAVLLTQDCDLEQDWFARQDLKDEGLNKEKKERLLARLLGSVLFAEATTAQDLKDRIDFDKRVVERFEQNKDERYQLLSPAPKEQDLQAEGFPALGLDFKKYFAIPVDEVYLRVQNGEARRRSALQVPYSDHLSDRFFAFQSRIGLDVQHVT